MYISMVYFPTLDFVFYYTRRQIYPTWILCFVMFLLTHLHPENASDHAPRLNGTGTAVTWAMNKKNIPHDIDRNPISVIFILTTLNIG